MGTLLNDLRYALRMLRKSPGFVVISVLTLALGIGANTAIFSIVNSVLLRGLPFRDSGRLVAIHEIIPQFIDRYPVLPVSLNNYQTWRKRCHSFDAIGLAGGVSMALTGSDEPQQLDGAAISANFLDVLGVHPSVGRSFLPEEDQPGHDHVVILTNAMWRHRFHSDPEILGKTITLDGAPYALVGVLPEWFNFPKGYELGPLLPLSPKIGFLKPLGLGESVDAVGGFDYAAVGRLRRDVSREQALTELNVVQEQIVRDSKEPLDLRAELVPLRVQIEGPARHGLLLLLGAVGAVLLIACVNLANLLLARLPARRREAAIRIALGASRTDLIRQMMTESCLLALIGGTFGIALTYLNLGALLHWAPADLPRINDVRVDGRVLEFGFALSLLTGILCSVLPAWRATLTDPQQELKSGGTRATEPRHSLRLREILTAVEVGLSTALLLIAALLTTSLARILHVDTGFAVEHVLTADVDLTMPAYSQPAQRARFYDEVLASARILPGVTAAGWINRLPLQGELGVSNVSAVGDTRPPLEQPIANYRFVSPGYLNAMGIAIVRGREIAEADRGRDVAVISERLAQSLWPGRDPIGQKFTTSAGSHPMNEIIGVVRDIRGIQLDQPPVPMVYVPSWERAETAASLVVRTTADPTGVAGAIREAIHKVDAGVPIAELRPMTQIVSESVGSRRFQMVLVGAFSIGALILATLGIYGVVSQSVAQRLTELGIRRALGANSADIFRLILRQAMAPVVIGLAAGIFAALAAGRAFRAFLFGISASDPRAIFVVAGIVIVAALLACQIPVRRALRADPMLALRYE